MGQERGYFEFTRRERAGIIGLVVIILVLAVMPAFFPRQKPVAGGLTFETFSGGLKKGQGNDQGRFSAVQPAAAERGQGQSFVFDPNTLTAEGWKKLGLRDRTIQTIQHFIEKGGRFRKPDDIRRIYGLIASDCERLIPFIRIKTPPIIERSWTNSYVKKKAAFPPDSSSGKENTGLAGKQHGRFFPANKPIETKMSFRPAKPYTAAIIEVNAADSSAFISLPGIGSKLAARIMLFREKLGGFYSVEQVKEVYGLPDSTYLKITPRLICDAAVIKKIGINSADAGLLKQHPYIRWNIANALVNYRNQHGPFSSLEELKNITSIESQALVKLLPYLTLETGQGISGP